MVQLAAAFLIVFRYLSPTKSKSITFAMRGNQSSSNFRFEEKYLCLVYERAAKSIILDNRFLHDMIGTKLG